LFCLTVGVNSNCYKEAFHNGSTNSRKVSTEGRVENHVQHAISINCIRTHACIPGGFEIVEDIETEVRHFRLRWREYEEREGLGFGEFVSEEDERVTESSFFLAPSVSL